MRNYKICILFIAFALFGCAHKPEFAAFLEQNGYKYYVESKNRLDHYIHVHISKDDIFFNFSYYDDENYLSFQFCDLQLNQCYKQLFGDAKIAYFQNRYTEINGCIYMYKGDEKSFHQLSDPKCDSFQSDDILKRMNDEITQIAQDMDSLLEKMISLSS